MIKFSSRTMELDVYFIIVWIVFTIGLGYVILAFSLRYDQLELKYEILKQQTEQTQEIQNSINKP